jgi:hypothetical protein
MLPSRSYFTLPVLSTRSSADDRPKNASVFGGMARPGRLIAERRHRDAAMIVQAL